jgi:hypothetical protein
MAEKGNRDAFERGLRHLTDAELLLAEAEFTDAPREAREGANELLRLRECAREEARSLTRS